jgi:[acyl-carrier-protein] S-malonyltransferase
MPGPLVVAGYSVGELSAWGVAGLLDYEAVLDLAVQRAAVHDTAVWTGGHPRSQARYVGSNL